MVRVLRLTEVKDGYIIECREPNSVKWSQFGAFTYPYRVLGDSKLRLLVKHFPDEYILNEMRIERTKRRYWQPEPDPRTRITTSAQNWYKHYPWQDKKDANGRIKAVGIRRQHLMLEPYCRKCMERNRVTEGNQVDHIKPINQNDPYDTENGRYGEFLNHDNLQTLCSFHHNQKSSYDKKWHRENS